VQQLGAPLHDATAFTFRSFTMCCSYYCLATSASTWHRRLGHLGVDALFKLSSDSSVVFSRRTHDFCHACQLGRHTRIPFANSMSHTDNIFDLIHCDLWTSPVVSVSGHSTTWSLLMTTPILCGPFLCELNLTPFPTCQKNSHLSPHSLATPSKLFSATMVVSSTMPPLKCSSPLMGWFCRCLAPTPLHRMVKPSVLFSP
jgi:hypothetical protein